MMILESRFGPAALGAAAVAFASALASPTAAETWNMATPYPEANFHTQNIQQFAEDVAAATDGELTIQVHAANSLIAHPEIRNAVRSGTVPLGEFLLGRLANEHPIFELDLLPFVVADYDEARRMWALSRDQIEQLLSRQNIRTLFSVPWPNNGIYTDRTVNAVDDLSGLRFRTYNTTTDRLAELVGAVPTQVEVSDIAQAFATGRVEAMITSAATGVAINAWDFVERYYDVQSFLGKNIVVVNERMFSELPEHVQEAVMKAAATAEQRGWQMSKDNDATMAAVLTKNGILVEPPSDKLQAGLEKVGTRMLDEWLERAGPEGAAIIDRLQN